MKSPFNSNYEQGIFVPKNIEKCLNYNGRLTKDVKKIQYKSSWERVFCNFCDKELNIITWGYEIIEIPYYSKLDNKTHRYIVDFILVLKDRSGNYKKYAVEIKPASQSAVLDDHGNVKFPKPPKKNTTKELNKWIEKYSIIQRNSEKWDSAREWCKKNGFEFKVVTEGEMFGKSKE